MPDFWVDFHIAPFEELDQLALLANQDYNLGGAGDWFGNFRGGLYGFYSRLYGVQRHYADVHAWLPNVRIGDAEYHLTSILFHLDSALECLTFALNALGWIVMPSGFRDVADAKALRRISPADILGDPSRSPPVVPLAGYQNVFPEVQRTWQSKTQLISKVRDLHDVSKHRQTIYLGGQLRMDAPTGFFEGLGIPEDVRSQFWPHAEIILMDDPKLPAVQRQPKAVQQRELLEDLVPAFAGLIGASAKAALRDALAHVPLKEKQFRV
jgi:hypothetical protein